MKTDSSEPASNIEKYGADCRRAGLGRLSLIGGAVLLVSVILMSVLGGPFPNLALGIAGAGFLVFLLLVFVDAACGRSSLGQRPGGSPKERDNTSL